MKSYLTPKEDGLYLIPEEKMPKKKDYLSVDGEFIYDVEYKIDLTQAIKEANIKVAKEDYEYLRIEYDGFFAPKQGEVYEVPLKFEVKTEWRHKQSSDRAWYEFKGVNMDDREYEYRQLAYIRRERTLELLDQLDDVVNRMEIMAGIKQPEAKTEQESQEDIWFEFVKTCIQHSPFELNMENAKKLFTITRNK